MAESASVTPDNNAAQQYPVLTPGQQVDVSKVNGTDGTVSLTADQIKDHFVGTLVNNDTNDKTSGQGKIDNTHNITIGDDGSVALTSTDPHDVYNTFGDLKSDQVTGHQVAHVSFDHDIDFSHDFSMTGALGIGNKTGADAGDGIGIIFAPGDPAYAATGGAGQMLGLGNLHNAFGFVYDNYHNGADEDGDAADPGTADYFGWRTTDSKYGLLQADTDVRAASTMDLSNRANDPFYKFAITYDAASKVLTVTLADKYVFTRTISDTTSGYSISIAASTGYQTNNYAARIDSFDYTPKTTQVDVSFTTPTTTPLATETASTATPAHVTANVGDTVLVFSSEAAAQRAIAADPKINPNLVTVIPSDADNNVYVVDGSQASTKYISGDSTASDGAYYSYVVTGDATQSMSVPVSLTYKATITPIDKATGKAIQGIAPIEVNAVAGKSTVVDIPGFTPATVTIPTPEDGQPVNYDLIIDMSKTVAEGTTTTGDVNPIEHYYTATGETIDGTPVVTANVTVGTNQSVTDALNAQQPIGSDGKVITDGSTPAYTWSTVPNAAATDSTDSSAAQDSKSILVPTQSTLDYWIQKATDNQTAADKEKAAAQDIYDTFVASPDITADQKTAAKSLLDSVNAVYENLSKTNADAKASLEDAKNSTDPETIVTDSQAGYAGISGMDTSLSEFKNDVDNMSTTNSATQASMVTFSSWSQVYGTTLENPKADFGTGFGATVTADQLAGLFANPDNFYYVAALDSDTSVTPKDVGAYYFKLTEKGRSYIKSLTPDNPNAGLYVSGIVTITPADATPTIQDTSVVYGADPTITGSLGSDLANTDHSLTQDDFEIIDNTTGKAVLSNQLQAGGDYTIQYTTDAQNTLKEDTNYTFGNFGTAKLTVNPAAGNVAVTGTSVTYGDSLPSLSVSVNGADTSVLSADNFEIVDTMTNSVLPADKLQPNQLQADNNGRYKVQLTKAAQDTLSAANGNFKLTFGTGALTVNKRPITVNINDVTTDYDGSAHGANGFSIAKGDKLVDGDTSDALSVTLNPISETEIKTYTITGKSDSANYAVTVNNGTLKILGQTDDGKGNKTTTEKDAAGNVVRIDKQWADGSETIYKYDPDTGDRSVSEQKDKVQVGTSQPLTSDAKVTLSDGDTENTSTVVALDPKTNQPTFEHDTTTPTDNNTTTTTDTNGNVVKVVKTWPNDNSTTTYTYDPSTGAQSVKEEKDGEVPVTQDFTKGATQTTVKQGKTDTTVTAQPGLAPTFAHDTTTADPNDSTVTTTTDADGKVIKVVKTWPNDDSTTTYTYDPSTGDQSVKEEKDGEVPVTQDFTEGATQTTVKQGKTDTTVTAQPGLAPTFAHDTTTADPNDSTVTTTTDADGKVIKVVKTWPNDDSTTTYTYDPSTGDQSVKEEKDGEVPVTQDFTEGATQTTVKQGKTDTTVTAQPGLAPTFAHDTTTADPNDSTVTTTTDADGKVIKVV
ncbi:lectin-like domain-containing protein, partial [Levilactobacillus lanxiensis]